MQVQDLVTSALRLIDRRMNLQGHLAPGRTANSDVLTAGMNALNEMLDSFNTDRLFIYTITQAAYTFTSPFKQTYSIGPSGADFTATRPVKIERANIVNLANPSLPALSPLELISDAEWAALQVRAVSTSIPEKLYCDYAFPNANLNFYPYPSVANQVELHTWNALSQFVNLTDTFSLPPGYWEALRYNLALRLAPELGGVVAAGVPELAAQSLARIESLNAPSPTLVCDNGLPRSIRSSFNFYTGEVS